MENVSKLIAYDIPVCVVCGFVAVCVIVWGEVGTEQWDRASPVKKLGMEEKCSTELREVQREANGAANKVELVKLINEDLNLRMMMLMVMVVMAINPPRWVGSSVCLVGVVVCSGWCVSRKGGHFRAFRVSRYTKRAK